MGSYVVIKSMDDFQKSVLDSSTPVMVDFWAPWCAPCRMVSPVLEELAAEADGKFSLAKVNTDEVSDIAVKYSIVSIPTMIIFKDGKPLDKIIGAIPKEQLKTFIDKNC